MKWRLVYDKIYKKRRYSSAKQAERVNNIYHLCSSQCQYVKMTILSECRKNICAILYSDDFDAAA